MRHAIIKILFIMLLLPQQIWAADMDRKQPIHIEADHMEYDSANKVNVYTGNVIATQGTLSIRAYRIEVRQDKNGYQLGTAIGSEKNRVFFRQNRNETNEHIEGEAIKLEYNGATATIILTGDAILRRYKGNNLTDQISGHIITYNDNTSKFTVERGKNSSSPSGRVVTILTPPSD